MNMRALVMGVAFALMWSSAFTSARIIVADAPPLASLALRFAISGMIGVGFARALGQSWHLSRAQWRSVLIFGLCQNAAYLGLYFVAMKSIEASLASIIASTMPLLVAVLGWVVMRERLQPLAVIGLIVGFGGVAVIMGGRISLGADPFGVALCVIGALALAIATLAVRGAKSQGNVLMIVGLQMFVGGAVLAAVSPFVEDHAVALSWRLIGAFAYTVLIPGLAATWVWFSLVNLIGTVKASAFHFLNPFFGVAVAALILGERISAQDVIGVGIVMAGILAVQMSKQGPAPA
ncbi:MAG: DMT family transporter [Paracoccaceae bacterium]